MKKSPFLVVSILALAAVAILNQGCASTSSQQSHDSKQNIEKPPPKANRVQILMYDTTPRPKTDQLDFYEQYLPQKPYKIIALLTCEGAVDQEVVMTTAIYYRARQIGADGVINAGTITTQKEGTLNVADTVEKQIAMNVLGLGGSGARSVFRYQAIVYTDKYPLANTNSPLITNSQPKLDSKINAKLLGHWTFIPSPEKPVRGQLDIYFLPQYRYKSSSSLINTNGQPLVPTPLEEGRYYFAGNKLVTWGDKDDKPDPPGDFSVTDTQLTIYNKKGAVVFQKQTQ